ncbi:BLOC-1-related complex subunit 6 isoform X2 [Chironomus tepperi]|uniref:BLOC-1-related complex subunit 6 isoform X2 n=1 Tax=Chironomus tepperi TaxID=113505 RepID=UPI00391FA3E1
MENNEETQPKEIPSSSRNNPFLQRDIMSTSYGEISNAIGNQNYEKMDVTVDDNNMKHYVADDLEYKIKISSPISSSQPQPFSTLPKQLSSSLPPQLDSNVLSDLEIEAQYLAANVDNLTENLSNLLHSISAITSDNVEVYKTSVNKLTDIIDGNIKNMYSVMAKTEEISKSMHKAEQLSVRIKEIKRLVDMFEATL